MKKRAKIILIILITILFIYQIFNFILNSFKDLSVKNKLTNGKYSSYAEELTNIMLSATPQTCNWKTSETVHIMFNDDIEKNFKSYKYAITDSKEMPKSWDENHTNKDDNIVINQEGIKYLHIIVEDKSGKLSSDKILGPYRIDRSLPTARHELTPKVWKNQDVTITVIASDEKSGVKQIKKPDNQIVEGNVANYKVDRNGEYKFEIEDKVGNKMDYKVTVTNIDKDNPEVNVSQRDCSWIQSLDVNLTCNDNSGSGFKSYKYAITDSVGEPDDWSYDVTDINKTITIDKSGASKYLHVKMKDRAGNETEDKYFGPYQIDNILPTASHTLNINEWTNQNIDITVNSQDTLSGVKSIKLPEKDGVSQIVEGATATFTAEKNGDYTFIITDNAGNEYTYVVNISKIDKTLPTATALPDRCDWIQEKTVHIVCEDKGGSSFKHYQYAITDSVDEPENWSGNYTNSTGDITIDQNGIKYLHIKATDNVNNVNENIVFGPYYIDNVIPKGNIEIYENDWTNTELILNWSFSDDDSGFQKVILPDGRMSTEETGTFTVTENGTYEFKVYDKVGNYTIIKKEVDKIDKTAPIIILSQRPKDWTGNETIIIWECIDNQSGFKEIVLPNETVSTDSQGEFEVSESNTYEFTARDNIGNEATSKITISNIDKVAPELNLEADVSDWTNEDIEIKWTAEDLDSGINRIVLPDGTPTMDKKGSYWVKDNDDYVFIAYDNIGNSTKMNIEVNKIDKTEPELTLEQEVTETGELKIKWSITDEQSGIREVVLPNGSMVEESEGEFEITANGKYVFLGYDNIGNVTTKIVEVSDL